MQWFNVVTLLPAIGARVLLPLLTESFVSGRHDQSALVIKLAVASNLLIVIPIVAGLVALSPRILAAYGPDFSTGGATLTVTALVAALVVTVMPVGQTLAAEGKMWLGAGMNIGWAAIYIGCAVLFIHKGSLGIAFGLGIAYLCHSVWAGIFAMKHMRRVEVKAPDQRD
jgi:O-antigen/teichoic acid export membrane protein